MTYKPNFSKAMIKANEILIESNTIKDFPFSAVKIAEEFSDICCHSFRYAQAHNIPIHSFGSESAVIVELNGRFILFFDDTKNRCHCRYSILHEFGHLYLGHPIRTTLQPLSLQDKEAYGNYEVEANYFAAQLVMPFQLLKALDKKGYDINADFLRKNFGVSHDAAQRRVHCFQKNKSHLFSLSERKHDAEIVQKYKKFLGFSEPNISYIDLFSSVAI